jgi:hypothetical protein
MQELLRHASSPILLDLYAQAGMQAKREAQRKLARWVLHKGEALAKWTKLDHERNCQFPTASHWKYILGDVIVYHDVHRASSGGCPREATRYSLMWTTSQRSRLLGGLFR